MWDVIITLPDGAAKHDVVRVEGDLDVLFPDWRDLLSREVLPSHEIQRHFALLTRLETEPLELAADNRFLVTSTCAWRKE